MVLGLQSHLMVLCAHRSSKGGFDWGDWVLLCLQLLSDCHLLYCEQRLSLVSTVVQDRLLEYCNNQSLTTMTRSGCAYLMQVPFLVNNLVPSTVSPA